MSNVSFVKQSARKKFKQFLSVALAFTTTVSLSGFALLFAVTASAQVATLSDGDLVRGPDGIKVYIVKPMPHGMYSGWKRHIFNPAVFNMYGHLKWSNIKSVNQATIDAYHTSDLYRADGDAKVFSMVESGDSATKRWIENESAFVANGYSWDQIFVVNKMEKDYYAEGLPITTTSPAPTPSPTPVATGTGLTVSLASNTPSAGSIVADTTSADGAQAQANLLAVNFSAGSDGDVKVTTLKVKRTGISADADLANAYLYDGMNRLAEMTNVSSTYISFINASGLFTVAKGTTKTVWVKIDVTNGTTAGKTIGLSVNVASDVVAGTATVAGMFPVMGNMMTTATVSDLGKFDLLAPSPTGTTTVDPGQTNFEVFKLPVTVTDQKVKLSWLKLTNVGTISVTDLANIKLMDGATQLGATAANLASDATVTFDMSANPLVINAGVTKNLSLFADIVGGTNRTYRFSVQRSADIVVMDDNYGVYLKPDMTDSFSIVQAGGATTINSGSLTISVDPSSPNGNVALDYTDQEFARFNFKASGEAVKVTSLNASSTGATAGGLNNVKLYLDGTQVGSTADLSASASVAFTFGNSFIIPAGTTKSLVVKGEVKKADNSSFSATNSIQVSLVAGSSNAQGQTSLTAISTSAANGNTLTVQTGTLTTAANSGMSSATASLPTGVKGATGTKIASFVLTAGSGEAVDITQIVLKNSATAGLSLGHDFQNLTLKNGAAQIGTTIGALSTTASATYTFTPSSGAINLASGQQYVVDVYADILTGASNAGATAYVPVILDNVSATGKSTNSDASSATDRDSQNAYIATSGSLVVAAASDMPIAQNRAMGEVGQTLATFKLTTGAPEGINISKLIVTDTLSNTAAAATGSITNLKLFKADGTQVGTTVASMTSSGVGLNVLATFDGLALSLAKDSATVLTLKGDMNSYPNAVSGSAHTFKVQGNGDVTATGATSGVSIAMTGATISGNAQRAYRAELTITNAMSNFSGGAATDQNIGKYRFTNTSAGNYSITVTDIDLGLSTSKAAAAFTATRYVTLKRDAVNGTTVAKTQLRPGVLFGTSAVHFGDITSWTVTAGNTGEQTFSSFTIDASGGTGYVDIYVLADTTDTAATSVTISNNIGTGSNVVTWSDGVSSTITNVDNMPAVGATVTY